MIEETEEERSKRLKLEQEAMKIALELKDKMPPGVGFVLLMADFGEGGSTSYMSTIEREGAIKLVREWLEKVN